MIVQCNINNNYEIESLLDLNKLSNINDENPKAINKSKLARELGCDRRTISKYIRGYEKPKTKCKKSIIDKYYDIILELLSNELREFDYMTYLFRFLVDNHNLKCSESNFRKYINSHEEFKKYFTENKRSKNSDSTRFETEAGKQAQLDWKENMKIILNTGEVITINILCCILSFSRFRVYHLSLSKTQDILFNFLDHTFEVFGGVPHELLTDNMKTVMDEARTKYKSGKINNKFHQFANDYGFKTRACIAARPRTKGKVESPMRILDELKAYNGELDMIGLIKQLEIINERENTRFHKSYRKVPVMYLEKEKNFLQPLPTASIRSHYKIETTTLKVNKSSMISFKGSQYSVPTEFINKKLQLQVYDNQLHLYFNTNHICSHVVGENELNYLDEHYKEILGLSMPYKNDDEIDKIAKDNLKKLKGVFNE